MIIVLNGYPGVGKLTIGRELASLLDGRLLDIHSVYNVAFALTEFKSPEFRVAVEEVEAIAHKLILRLPDATPVVLTTVLAGDSDWAKAEWERIVRLGAARPPFLVVHVHCVLEENIRRIGPQRGTISASPATPKWHAATNRAANHSPVLRSPISSSSTQRQKRRSRQLRTLPPGLRSS